MEDEPESKEKDFFISYAHQDWQWANWINEQLEGAGYKTIFQAEIFHLGVMSSWKWIRPHTPNALLR